MPQPLKMGMRTRADLIDKNVIEDWIRAEKCPFYAGFSHYLLAVFALAKARSVTVLR